MTGKLIKHWSLRKLTPGSQLRVCYAFGGCCGSHVSDCRSRGTFRSFLVMWVLCQAPYTTRMLAQTLVNLVTPQWLLQESYLDLVAVAFCSLLLSLSIIVTPPFCLLTADLLYVAQIPWERIQLGQFVLLCHYLAGSFHKAPQRVNVFLMLVYRWRVIPWETRSRGTSMATVMSICHSRLPQIFWTFPP